MTDVGRKLVRVIGRARFELLCVGVLGSVFGWTGCSVERNYELLSFFFDGVPNPNALPILAAAGDPATIRASATYSAHTPYLEGQCVQCHGQGFTMGGIDPGICLDCHGDVPDQHRFMHGPVASGACVVCHVPHESAYPHLLKSDAQAVCAQCHAPEMLSVDRVPEHGDPGTSCLRCHTGHGDDRRYMLRDEPLPVAEANSGDAAVDGADGGENDETGVPAGPAGGAQGGSREGSAGAVPAGSGG